MFINVEKNFLRLVLYKLFRISYVIICYFTSTKFTEADFRIFVDFIYFSLARFVYWQGTTINYFRDINL